jgi:hypothetical protein
MGDAFYELQGKNTDMHIRLKYYQCMRSERQNKTSNGQQICLSPFIPFYPILNSFVCVCVCVCVCED